MRYLVVMHKTGTGYCAGAQTFPAASPRALRETESRFREALRKSEGADFSA